MNEKDVARNLEKLLSRHGYSFQYRVVKEADALRKREKSVWLLEGTEIPVGEGNDLTHIDMVLSANLSSYHEKRRLFLIGECKRADPSRSNWCFLKSPYTWRNPNRTNSSIQFDKVVHHENGTYSSLTQIAPHQPRVFDLGFETKTYQPSEGIADPRGKGIESAVAQALRGTRGYINYLCRLTTSTHVRIQEDGEATFIPAIFTTAKLFTTVSDISSCELEDGRLLPGSLELTPADWLWFNHNRSTSLSHALSFDYEANIDFDANYRSFTRSIAIVSYTGIEEFLGSRFYASFL